MDIFLYTLALLTAAIGLVGTIVPILPSVPLSFVALLLANLSSTPLLSSGAMLICLILCIAITVIDFFLPVYFTKRFGGSSLGKWGATIGMIVGFISFPPLGIIVVPAIGAILGELLNDKSAPERAFKVGMGTFLAFIVGTGIKFIYSMWVLWIVIEALFTPAWESIKSMF